MRFYGNVLMIKKANQEDTRKLGLGDHVGHFSELVALSVIFRKSKTYFLYVLGECVYQIHWNNDSHRLYH